MLYLNMGVPLLLVRISVAASHSSAPSISSFQVVIPHGEPVTVETFLAWRERFEAELALERAK